MEDTKPRRIRPADENLGLKEGDDIDRFLCDFDDVSYVDGASDLDKCIQLKFYIPDKDLKTVVGSMEGYKRKKWSMLKRNMKQLWSAGLLPL